MIFKTDVKRVAETHLNRVLSQYPGIVKSVTQGEKWEKFLSLTAEKCNQLDVAGYIPSREALADFIVKRTRSFAVTHIDELIPHHEKERESVIEASKIHE